MKPHIHSRISVHKFGGVEADYQDIHNWFDQTKAHLADMRHRAILHNAWGIFLCEQVFGDIEQLPDGSFKKADYITNSDGKQIQVRDIGEQHVLDDLGRIPALYEGIHELPMYQWFGGPIRSMKTIKLEDLKEILEGRDKLID